MNIVYILVFLLCLSVLEAERNRCCPEGEQLVPKKGCSKNGTIWLKHNCEQGAYPIFSNKNMELNENDDVLLYGDIIIASDKYCVGQMNNETVVLVCFPSYNKAAENSIVISICIFISVLCLVTTLVVYIILPRLRDIQGKCIMNMIICLLIASIFVIALRNFRSYSTFSCYFVACTIYFSFLGTFFWMNLIGFHIWRSIVNPLYPQNPSKTFKVYNIYGWGCPILLLLIANIAHWYPGNHIKPTWGKHTCWFSELQSAIVYLHIPNFILIGFNITLFILTIIAFRKQTNETNNKKHRSRKYKFILYLKLFVTMGICWIFEPIDAIFELDSLEAFWFITTFINAMQGVLIFLILIVFRKRVRRELGKHKGICCQKLPEDWATIAVEDCEELSEEAERLTNNENDDSL